jgi:hypothetical protein
MPAGERSIEGEMLRSKPARWFASQRLAGRFLVLNVNGAYSGQKPTADTAGEVEQMLEACLPPRCHGRFGTVSAVTVDGVALGFAEGCDRLRERGRLHIDVDGGYGTSEQSFR